MSTCGRRACCPASPGTCAPRASKDIDFVVIRENTEGEYSGAGGRVHKGTPQEVAVQTTIFTRMGVERIMRYAFELARTRRKKVTSATKSNAMQHVMVFWDEVFSQVAKTTPMSPLRSGMSMPWRRVSSPTRRRWMSWLAPTSSPTSSRIWAGR